MIENWTTWTDEGTPNFSGTAETTLQIVRDGGERGRWFGVWSERVEPDDQFRIKVTTGGKGSVTVTFWDGRIASDSYKGSQQFGAGEIDSIIVIPADGTVDIFRVELRGWEAVEVGQSSIDTFTDILITDTIPDPPELAAPTMESVAVDGAEITITWSAVDGAELYELHEQENDGEWVEVYKGPNTSAIYGSFPAGDYCYRARSAAGTAVSEWSNILCGTVEESNEEIPVLNAIDNPENDGEYPITWYAVPNGDSYELQENRNERAWITIYEGPETEFMQSGNPVGSYGYRVRAIFEGDPGEWSAVVYTAHWEGEMYVIHIPQPDGLFEWTVTVSNTSGSMARYPIPPEDAAEKLIEEMIKDAPEDDPILLPPEIG